MLNTPQERLRDLELVIRSTSDYRRNKLRSIAGSVDNWDKHVQREKASYICIYVCMNDEWFALKHGMEDS